jgi:hypothetical protein
MLSQKCNGSLSVIWVELWHVEIINEVNELCLSRWSEGGTSSLDEDLFHDGLEEISVSVIVEVDDLVLVSFGVQGEGLQESLSDLSLSTSSVTDEEWRMID